jgi:DNA polymerase III alpha subunit
MYVVADVLEQHSQFVEIYDEAHSKVERITHSPAPSRTTWPALTTSVAVELRGCNDGELVRVAGCIIARQRPGTTKGFIFMSMEDETGIANVIIAPDFYEQERLLVTQSKFFLADGYCRIKME